MLFARTTVKPSTSTTERWIWTQITLIISGNFALFPHEVRKDYDEAERLYRRALELDLGHAHHMGNFAEFMEKVRKNYDEAERLIARRWNLIPKRRSSEKTTKL
jgi:YD repeat-containing protein